MKNIFKKLYVRVILYFFIIISVAPNLLYFPIKKVHETNYFVEDIYFNSIDNTRLNAWYIPAEKDFPTIVFSHGNGGNISYFFPMLEAVVDKGYGVFIYDYRGYGKSKGFPYEKGLYNDLRGAIRFLNTEKKIENKDIILWGLSIGGGVSSKIASESNFRAVILHNTFSNIKDEAKVRVRNILKWEKAEAITNIVPFLQMYDTYGRIDKITAPIFIIHSKGDEFIPYQQAQKNHSRNPNSILKIV